MKEKLMNSKNKQGKIICPITFNVINTNNSIKFENTYYTIKGFGEWIRTELKNKNNQSLIEYLSEQYQNDFDLESMQGEEFCNYFVIRSPMTNNPYEEAIKKQIFELYIGNYYNRQNVAKFINLRMPVKQKPVIENERMVIRVPIGEIVRTAEQRFELDQWIHNVEEREENNEADETRIRHLLGVLQRISPEEDHTEFYSFHYYVIRFFRWIVIFVILFFILFL